MWESQTGLDEMPKSKKVESEPVLHFRGFVQRYFSDIKMGTLKSESMDSYSFNLGDWNENNSEPVAGMRVTFEVKGKRAINIKPHLRADF